MLIRVFHVPDEVHVGEQGAKFTKSIVSEILAKIGTRVEKQNKSC